MNKCMCFMNRCCEAAEANQWPIRAHADTANGQLQPTKDSHLSTHRTHRHRRLPLQILAAADDYLAYIFKYCTLKEANAEVH